MNYSITSYISQKVRRFSFLIKRDGVFYNLFTLYEAVLPDMQDGDAFPLENGHPYCRFIKKTPGNEDKVFLSVDVCELTEEMIIQPWKDMVIDGFPIQSDVELFHWSPDDRSKSALIPLHEEQDMRHELVDMLPKRRCAAYVNYCIPQALPQDGILNGISRNEKVTDQIRELSKEYLKFDLTLNTKYYGGFVFATYNPIYRQIELSEDIDSRGIYCRVYYRSGQHEPLTFRIKAYDKNRQIIGQYERRNANGEFLSHFTFDVKFHSLDIDVCDSSDVLIDCYSQVTFIHKILLNIDTATKKVEYHDDDGKVLVVDKYENAVRAQIGEEEIHTLFGSSGAYTYEKFEKSLDFVFFDGDKERQDENRQKAQDCIHRILNSARTVCFIADIFFNKQSFVDFICPLRHLDLDIRIISSKEKHNAQELEELKATIEEHNHRVGSKISCRLMRGKAALHDRFVIADDKMWMLGCSLNEFGIRATTLIRVPQAYASKMTASAVQWWGDDNITEPL